MEKRLFESKELKVSLSGNLGFVSLDEVLRLLTRSSQKGSVDVSGQNVRGRIFVTKDGLALATTFNDEGIHRYLVKSGLVDEDILASVESGRTTLAPDVESSVGAIVDLLREITVESIYQLGLNGDSFEVEEGAETPYASPKPFDLESIIDDSKQRLTDWAEVSQTVTNLDENMSLSRDLGERSEVSISRDAWRVLSEIGSGSSVVTIAGELGTTDFWAARVAASLIDEKLLVVDEVHSSVEVQTPAGGAESFSDAEVVSEPPDEDLDPNESWWEEPEAEDGEQDASSEEIPAAETVEAPEDEVAEGKTTSIFGAFAPGASKEPAAVVKEDLSQVPMVDEGDDDEVEDDTEAFLEKVFSELDNSSDEEEGEEEGYGLLRRRRMGAMRDTSGDA
ncbi:MAG: DUF4388 domain-containing protein [Acidimicrobiia bacterium]